MVVLLHGYGGNEADLMGLALYLDQRLIKVSARAPLLLDFGGNAWFPIEVTDRGLALQFDQAGECVDLIRSLVLEMKTQYDAGEIYLLGFSQGASMALSTAFSNPGLCAGVAALSGVVTEQMLPAELDSCRNELPVIMTHGRQDAVIPVEQGRSSHSLLQGLSTELRYHEYDMGHEINQACLADVNAWLTEQIDGAHKEIDDAV